MAVEYPPPNVFSPKVPLGGSEQWLTVGFRRRVLVVVRTITTLNRLLDVLTLFEDDHRVQVVFTFNEDRPAILAAGVPELLQRLRVAVVPWRRATATRFDLAIAASENDDLRLLDAPTVLLPHGIGYQKFYPGGTVVAGMNPDRLVHDGAVVPAMIAVTHTEQREHLQRISPLAATRAVVVGDPCLDRLRAGAHRAEEYRAALGARGRQLVTIASTWGPASLLGTCPELPLRLVSDLPVDEYAVCAVLHPGITAAHSSWQLDSWLAQARRAGLRVIPPETGWQTAITAASCVIADESSVALYAAAQDRPLLLAGGDATTTVPGSPAALLAAQTARLLPDEPLTPQVRQAVQRHTAGEHEPVIKQAVADPDRSAAQLRSMFYELMGLPEPPAAAEFTSHPLPRTESTDIAAFVVGAEGSGATTVLTRFPVTTIGHRLEAQHIAAHATGASLRQLSAAAIVFTDFDDATGYDEWADAVLSRWPDAMVAAARVGTDCLATGRDKLSYVVTPRGRGLDPLLGASLVYLGLLGPAERITLGDHTFTVAIRAR